MDKDWIPVLVAVCTVFAAAIAALMNWVISRERRMFEGQLADKNSILSQKLVEIQSDLQMEMEHFRDSQKAIQNHELEEFKDKLARESEQLSLRRRTLENINEENWKNIIEKLRGVSKSALLTTRSVTGLIRECVDMDEHKFFTQMQEPLKNHAAFGTKIFELEGEMRPKDEHVFKELNAYCLKVFLDLDFDPAERRARKGLYDDHIIQLKLLEEQILRIQAIFIRARGLYPKLEELGPYEN